MPFCSMENLDGYILELIISRFDTSNQRNIYLLIGAVEKIPTVSQDYHLLSKQGPSGIENLLRRFLI